MHRSVVPGACSAAASSAACVKLSSTPSSANRCWNCFTTAFFGSVSTRTRGVPVQALQAHHHRQPADQFGDEPVLQQVFRLHRLAYLIVGACARS